MTSWALPTLMMFGTAFDVFFVFLLFCLFFHVAVITVSVGPSMMSWVTTSIDSTSGPSAANMFLSTAGLSPTPNVLFLFCICIFDTKDLLEVICMLSLHNVLEKGQENRVVHLLWFSDLEMWIWKVLHIDIL